MSNTTKSQVNPNSQIPTNNGENKKSGDKIYDIRERTFRFSERILEIADLIPLSPATHRLCDQLVGSGTSIGANLEEADGSITKRDFVNKIAIARKEAKETKYWLRLVKSKYLPNGSIGADIQEVQELVNILSAIINKTRKN